jgi:hypothetical protein
VYTEYFYRFVFTAQFLVILQMCWYIKIQGVRLSANWCHRYKSLPISWMLSTVFCGVLWRKEQGKAKGKQGRRSIWVRKEERKKKAGRKENRAVYARCSPILSYSVRLWFLSEGFLHVRKCSLPIFPLEVNEFNKVHWFPTDTKKLSQNSGILIRQVSQLHYVLW